MTVTNLKRGEVSIDLAGTSYVLRLATNEWCALEDEHDKTTDELIAEFETMATSGRLNMRFIRNFFRAALAGGLPDISEEEAGALMSDIGLAECAGMLGRVIVASMPESAPAENPPKAVSKAGTGKGSKSSSARSATIPPNSGD